VHQDVSKAQARDRAIELLGMVGIPSPRDRVDSYPHEFSGGMRQRAMIAMALSNEPKLLIADEPTTALDVTVQAQILDLIARLQQELGMALVLITHDLGVVADVADRVVVMYAGRKVEEAPVEELFARPRHPYTLGLLGSMPHLGESIDNSGKRLVEIPGLVPSLREEMAGCLFAPRCSSASERCRAETPPLEEHARGHLAACWHPVTIANRAKAEVA
jgi:peptide/nickel transport system ATP-binding protein